jgi:NAD(P)-dependent dehydrogenase (short-subunit alcohol dehydrogenase family)
MFRTDLLVGKRILVTGGGTGLGRSMAERFASLGAALVLAGRRAEVLVRTAAEIRAATGARVDTHSVDVRDPAAVDAMMEAVFAGEGGLDVLVNNAAANFIARTESLSPRAADTILNITLHGPLYCTLAAGKRWIAQGLPEGAPPRVVLSILATYAWHGSAYVTPSAMAKAGVHAMMQSLAVEWGPKGVRQVGIAPGPFPTKGAWDRLLPRPEMAGYYETRGPLKRPGRHDELGNLAAYLVSDGAAYVNGDCVAIDGGRWLKGAGNFSFLEDLSDAEWDAIRDRGRGRPAG